MSKKSKSDIPVGTQFSPDLIDLRAFAAGLVKYSGDVPAMLDEIWLPSVRHKPPKKSPTARLRRLPLEAAIQYGLLERRSYRATALARCLAASREPEVYDIFAAHILHKLRGLRVLQGIDEMEADRRPVTGDTLAQYLTDHGLRVTVHNTAINSLRMWLAKAGIFPLNGRGTARWQVDPAQKQRILGLSDEMIFAISDLTEEQRAFLTALCRIDPVGWHPANGVRDLAEATLGVRIGRSSLSATMEPLRSAGLIEYRSRGTGGGKPSELRTTSQFQRAAIAPFLEHTVKELDPEIARYFRRRAPDIVADLDSSDTRRKGQALEAFAIYIMRLLGLRFAGWNRRAHDTGQAEVDAVLLGSLGAIPTRWQIQCKNLSGRSGVSGKVDVDHVAKEVGLLPITHATHILIMARAKFTRDALLFVDCVMERSPVSIFLLDDNDVKAIIRSPGAIGQILARKSREILRKQAAAGLFTWKR